MAALNTRHSMRLAIWSMLGRDALQMQLRFCRVAQVASAATMIPLNRSEQIWHVVKPYDRRHPRPSSHGLIEDRPEPIVYQRAHRSPSPLSRSRSRVMILGFCHQHLPSAHLSGFRQQPALLPREPNRSGHVAQVSGG